MCRIWKILKEDFMYAYSGAILQCICSSEFLDGKIPDLLIGCKLSITMNYLHWWWLCSDGIFCVFFVKICKYLYMYVISLKKTEFYMIDKDENFVKKFVLILLHLQKKMVIPSTCNLWTSMCIFFFCYI